jgi:hypothetical protein
VPTLLAEDSHDVADCDAEDAPSFGFPSDINPSVAVSEQNSRCGDHNGLICRAGGAIVGQNVSSI